MKKIGLLILLLLMVISCTSDENDDLILAEEIIFGEIYGQCLGDCRNLFLLTEQGIYEDSNSDIDFGDLIEISDWENTTFNSQPLAKDKFELAQKLIEFPDNLLQSNNEITEQIWADFDYFIQIKTNTTSKTWVFDRIKETTDSKIKQYMEKMIAINDQLNDY